MTTTNRSLKVFLCNADRDQKMVLSLYSRLKKDDVDAWLDEEELIGGQNREREIRKAVRDADVVIVCLSKQFNQAGDQQREVRIALETANEKPEGQIFIIPARLEECEIPENLQKWQWVDLYESDGYAKLTRALKARANSIGITLRLKPGQPPTMGGGATSRPRVGSTTRPKPEFNTAIIVALIGLVGTIVAALLSSPLIGKWSFHTPTPVIENSPFPSPILTVTPESMPLPTKTSISLATLNPLIGKDGMQLIEIPAGEFQMGSKGNDPDERPVHTIYLDDYLIDQTEVTNAMYALCVEARKCDPPRLNTSITQNESNAGFYYGNLKFDRYPVIYVSWNDAKAYCAWVGRRLPTEAEWEKAASWDNKNQIKRKYPWGERIDCSYANYRDNNNLCVGDTTLAGSYPDGASYYGVLDMAGNVWEWVFDRYDPEYYGEQISQNPMGPTSGDFRVIRGGSFLTGREIGNRSSDRDKKLPDFASQSLGFRCAMVGP